MSQYPSPNSEPMNQQQQEFIERVRKGLLVHLSEKGGRLSLGEMHDFSMNKFFVQHQAFSRMMESLVDNELVEYDHGTGYMTITEAGTKFIAS